MVQNVILLSNVMLPSSIHNYTQEGLFMAQIVILLPNVTQIK